MEQATQIRKRSRQTAATGTRKSVYSGERQIVAPPFALPKSITPNTRLKMDGLTFLSALPDETIPVGFLDPQYRGVLEKLKYGNEADARQKKRVALQQMSETRIGEFISAIDRVLMPSGHLFLWVDKFHLCQGIASWFTGTSLEIVDLVTWDKQTFGMGYRTRRRAEYCVILQKAPKRAKGIWTIHDIVDVWQEKFVNGGHPHAKPVRLQEKLIAAVTNKGDYVIDPAAGSFSVMEAAINQKRNFLGCDLVTE